MAEDPLRQQIRAVRALVRRHRRHRELTDDLEQAGHLGYCRSLADERYDPDLVPITTWAHRGALHAIQSCYRAEVRHRVRVERFRRRARGHRWRPDWRLSQLEKIDVREAVRSLEPRQRSLIIAWFWAGITPTEWARIQGISPWIARQLRDEAFARLRELLS
jgi:RNA polymerase sigma factor (sigma-70 family)